MKVSKVLWGFVIVVVLIAICRANGGESLLDFVENPQAPDVDLDPRK